MGLCQPTPGTCSCCRGGVEPLRAVAFNQPCVLVQHNPVDGQVVVNTPEQQQEQQQQPQQEQHQQQQQPVEKSGNLCTGQGLPLSNVCCVATGEEGLQVEDDTALKDRVNMLESENAEMRMLIAAFRSGQADNMLKEMSSKTKSAPRPPKPPHPKNQATQGVENCDPNMLPAVPSNKLSCGIRSNVIMELSPHARPPPRDRGIMLNHDRRATAFLPP